MSDAWRGTRDGRPPRTSAWAAVLAALLVACAAPAVEPTATAVIATATAEPSPAPAAVAALATPTRLPALLPSPTLAPIPTFRFLPTPEPRSPTATARPRATPTPPRTPTIVRPTATRVTLAKATVDAKPPDSPATCPASHPIKGEVRRPSGEKLFYDPDARLYARIYPEACFATVYDALDAGYRRAPT